MFDAEVLKLWERLFKLLIEGGRAAVLFLTLRNDLSEDLEHSMKPLSVLCWSPHPGPPESESLSKVGFQLATVAQSIDDTYECGKGNRVCGSRIGDFQKTSLIF